MKNKNLDTASLFYTASLFLVVNLVVSLISVSGFAQADRFGNGGGLSEKQITITNSEISDRLSECLENPICHSDFYVDKNLVAAIRDSVMAAEQSGLASLVKVISATTTPGIFPSPQQFYFTKPQVGATIYINSDRLKLFEQQNQRPLSDLEAFQILFVSYGIQQQSKNLLRLEKMSRAIFATGTTNLKAFQFQKSSSSLFGYLREDYLRAEEWVKYFYLRVPQFIQYCLEDVRCKKSQKEILTLTSLKQHWNDEIKNNQPDLRNKIKFSTPEEDPQLFKIDGVVKSAVTGLNYGDPIYFNLNHLYQVRDNRLYPAGYTLMLSLLIHELGHHTGEVDHAALDIMSDRLTKYIEKYHPVITFDEDPDSLGLNDKRVAHFRSHIVQSSLIQDSNNSAQVFLSDERSFFDFTQEIKSTLICPAPFKLKEYRMNSVGWNGYFRSVKEIRRVPYNFDGQATITISPWDYKLLIDATIVCENPEGQKFIELIQRALWLRYILEFRPSVISSSGIPTRHYIYDQFFLD